MTDLGLLSASLADCRRCPRLVAWRKHTATVKRAAFAAEEYWGRPVSGFGDPDASVVLVGLAPAAHGANRTGRMFTGDRSGDFLVAALHRTGFASQPASTHAGDGLELFGCYITSAVKCAPPANRPTGDEQANCRTWLEAELDLLDPQVVVALGGMGYRSVREVARRREWGRLPASGFGHGVEIDLPAGPLVLASYHPSQQNTFTGRLTPEMLDAVLRRARRRVEGSTPTG